MALENTDALKLITNKLQQLPSALQVEVILNAPFISPLSYPTRNSLSYVLNGFQQHVTPDEWGAILTTPAPGHASFALTFVNDQPTTPDSDASNSA